MFSKLYTSFANYARDEDGFSSSGNPGAFLLAAFGMLVILIIQLFIVQWLWNNVLTRVVPGVRPLPSLLWTLGLLVLVDMLFASA